MDKSSESLFFYRTKRVLVRHELRVFGAEMRAIGPFSMSLSFYDCLIKLHDCPIEFHDYEDG